MVKRRIGLVMVTSPHSGGVFQYENLLAESVWNNRDRYHIVMICNDSYWINWCIDRNIKFIEDKINPIVDDLADLFLKYPQLGYIYSFLTSEKQKLTKRENIELLIYGQQEFFFPDMRIRQLCTVHDLMHRYESGFPERGLKDSSKEDRLLTCEIKFAHGILVDSQLGRSQVIESYLQRKKRRPLIQVLPYTVSKHISSSEEEYISTPVKYIFYPAQFWQHKNHLNLLKAVNLLKQSILDIHLVLVGSEKNSLGMVERFIKENHLEDFVTIHGFVTNRQITYLYRHAILMIMPSYYGPTNIPPLEAMALGCPVAVSDNYAMGEQVGDAGLLFDPDSPEEMADCIRRVWNDSALRDEMRKNGYRQIAKWQPADFERVLTDTIDTILDGKRKRLR